MDWRKYIFFLVIVIAVTGVIEAYLVYKTAQLNLSALVYVFIGYLFGSVQLFLPNYIKKKITKK